MTHNPVSACDRHWKTPTVTLKTAAYAAILRVEVVYEWFCLLLLGNFHLALQFLGFSDCLAVFLVALLFSFALCSLCLLLLPSQFCLLACQLFSLALAFCLGPFC